MSPQKKVKNKKVNPRIRAVKEQKKNKAIIIGFIVTATIIVGMIGYAILYSVVLKDNIPVAKINGNKIDNAYYEARVRFERRNYIEYYNSLKEIYSLFADDPDTANYYQQQMLQIQSTLYDITFFGEMVLDSIINDEITAMHGKETGLAVSDSEIDEVLQELMNYFPDEEPIEELPGSESDSEGETVQTPSPTATPFTEEMYQQELTDYLADLESIGVSEKHLRKYIFHYLMNQKVHESVSADVANEAEQVSAKHILVATADEAEDVLKRLEEETWDEIAAEVSLDTSNKDNSGDLGWFPHGQMVAEFDEAAFGLEIGEISKPIETQFGWHIIELVGKEMHALSETEYANVQNVAYDEWFTELKSETEVEINEVWRDIVPSEPNIE